MKVKVAEGVQVCHGGKVWRDGQTADVPADVAAEWLACGWVTEMTASKSRRKTP